MTNTQRGPVVVGQGRWVSRWRCATEVGHRVIRFDLDKSREF